MKDLICITAHCPTPEKRQILLDLVLGLQPIRNDFDIMVVSHTPITFDVQERVDWAIYDKDNELLKEWKYQNSPWFHPKDKLIQSIFFGAGNTYLPVHKQLITGYSMAKTFGYKKIHCVEYDGLFKDFTEFYDNSKALDEYDAILYKKPNGYGEINIEWGLGCFHAAKISSLDERAFNYTSDSMKEELANLEVKTTEKRTEDIYTANNNKVLFKDHNLLTANGNSIRMVNFHALDLDMQWAVPIFNQETGIVDFIAWNESSDEPCSVTVIVNNDRIHTFNNLPRYGWRLEQLGSPEKVQDIVVLVNNKLKHHIQLNEDNIEEFKKYNFIKTDIDDV
jgi:hypothetical protein